MNIKFSYLYRDSGNNKKHEDVIFSNKIQVSLSDIITIMDKHLISGEWFSAKEWDLPDLHFDEWDEELDHIHHEFGCIEETSDSEVKEDILDFLERIKISSL